MEHFKALGTFKFFIIFNLLSYASEMVSMVAGPLTVNTELLAYWTLFLLTLLTIASSLSLLHLLVILPTL